MIWDYDEKELLHKDPVLYLEKQLTTGMTPTTIIDKWLVMKHFHELHLPKEHKAYLAFLLRGNDWAQHVAE